MQVREHFSRQAWPLLSGTKRLFLACKHLICGACMHAWRPPATYPPSCLDMQSIQSTPRFYSFTFHLMSRCTSTCRSMKAKPTTHAIGTLLRKEETTVMTTHLSPIRAFDACRLFTLYLPDLTPIWLLLLVVAEFLRTE